ncbi:MAG: transcriptional repressor [Candidatus Hydrogenedens sp.]|nr:transcriptional repressor [Candidatus Hydrogenedens sp.]
MILDSAWLKGKMAAFQADCDRLGLKVTHQRLEIYRAVVSTEEHPDVTTVHRRVRRRIPTISLDTVYRNLRLLAEHGLVSSVGMSSENARFDGNMAPHHHFVCVKCGLIRDFTAEGAGGRIPDAARAFGEPLSVHLEVKGVCVACRDGSKQ